MVYFIWKSLSAKGRWSMSRWEVVIGLTSIAIGEAILSSCGFEVGWYLGSFYGKHGVMQRV